MKTKRVRPVLVEIKGYVGQYPFLGLNDNKLSLYTNENPSNFNVIAQELILISLEDKKIEENDYYYFSKSNSLHKHLGTLPLNKYKHDGDKCFKVIARQSQIPPEYISKFIEQYNQGGVEDLEIEMEKCWINSDNVKGNSFTEVAKFEPSINDFDAVLIIQPKLTNGFVTIVEKEVISYTEEEVKSLCSGAYSLGLSSLKSEIPDLEEMMELDNWFESNKKK